MAGALGFDWLCAAGGLRDLYSAPVASDWACKDAVGACRTVTGRDGHKPATGVDEARHFAGGGVEVGGWTARVFNRVSDAAGFGFGSAKGAAGYVVPLVSSRSSCYLVTDRSEDLLKRSGTVGFGATDSFTGVKLSGFCRGNPSCDRAECSDES